MAIEDVKEKAEDLLGHAQEFADTYYKLTVLRLSQKAANYFSHVAVVVVLASVGMLAIMFVGLALAWWLGDILDNRAAGFLIVGGIFLIKTAVLILFRKRIIFPIVRDRIIRRIYEQPDKDI